MKRRIAVVGMLVVFLTTLGYLGWAVNRWDVVGIPIVDLTIMKQSTWTTKNDIIQSNHGEIKRLEAKVQGLETEKAQLTISKSATPKLSSMWVQGLILERSNCNTPKVRTSFASQSAQHKDGVWEVVVSGFGWIAGTENIPITADQAGKPRKIYPKWLVDDNTQKIVPIDEDALFIDEWCGSR